MLVFATAYLLIGLVFGALSDWAATNVMRLAWRRFAWLVSGIVFATHIGYGHFRLGDSPRRTAMLASASAALGAGALAVAGNVHELVGTSSYRPSLAIALIAWPLRGRPADVCRPHSQSLQPSTRRAVTATVAGPGDCAGSIREPTGEAAGRRASAGR